MSALSTLNVMSIQSIIRVTFLKKCVTPQTLMRCRVHSSCSVWARHSNAVPRKNVNTKVQTESRDIEESDEQKFLSQFNPCRKDNPETDTIVEMPYGDIRFDVQNKPTYFPNQNTKDNVNIDSESVVNLDSMHTKSSKRPSQKETSDKSASKYDTNYFDEQYFENHKPAKAESHMTTVKQGQNMEELESDHTAKVEKEKELCDHIDARPTTDTKISSSYSDEQYFGQHVSSKVEENQVVFKKTLHNDVDAGDSNVKLDDNLNLFDEQYFTTESSEATNFDSSSSFSCKSVEDSNGEIKLRNEKSQIIRNEKITKNQKYNTESVNVLHSSSEEDQIEKTMANIELPSKRENLNEKKKEKKVHKKKEGQSAMDVVKEFRQQQNKPSETDKASTKMTPKQLDANPWAKTWDGKVDSHGFRVLSGQVTNLKYYLEEDIVHLMKKRIIYEDDDIVAVDKPYGLASHGGPGVHHSVGRILKPLAQKISKSLDTLYLVHRLDKETTGVMLLAKNDKMASRLGDIFKKRQVIKKYWVLTKGVPVPEEGVIDIPMTEGTVDGKHRMTLRPNYPSEMKTMRKGSQWRSRGQEAITNFRVLSQYMSTALVECQPESGIKHQIRCHLAFALNTPILGDHKYSHLSRIAPQKLHPDILQRLGMRQSKVRTLPMHLHAKSIVLPEFKDGRNLFINADLPKYFQQNMRWLKIKPPK